MPGYYGYFYREFCAWWDGCQGECIPVKFRWSFADVVGDWDVGAGGCGQGDVLCADGLTRDGRECDLLIGSVGVAGGNVHVGLLNGGAVFAVAGMCGGEYEFEVLLVAYRFFLELNDEGVG